MQPAEEEPWRRALSAPPHDLPDSAERLIKMSKSKTGPGGLPARTRENFVLFFKARFTAIYRYLPRFTAMEGKVGRMMDGKIMGENHERRRTHGVWAMGLNC